MNFLKILPVLGLVLTFSSVSYAKDSCGENLLFANARADRWAAQRQQIEFLEKTRGADYVHLERAYRSLIQDLFATSADDRAANVNAILANPVILSMVDITAPATRFTEDLIRAMDMVLTPKKVLEKLHMFADLEAKKLSQ